MFYCMLRTGVVFVVPLLCIEIDHIQDQAFTCVAYITVCVMYQVISIVYVWHKMYEKWHSRWRKFVDEHGRNPWRNMHFDSKNNKKRPTTCGIEKRIYDATHMIATVESTQFPCNRSATANRCGQIKTEQANN